MKYNNHLEVCLIFASFPYQIKIFECVQYFVLSMCIEVTNIMGLYLLFNTLCWCMSERLCNTCLLIDSIFHTIFNIVLWLGRFCSHFVQICCHVLRVRCFLIINFCQNGKKEIMAMDDDYIESSPEKTERKPNSSLYTFKTKFFMKLTVSYFFLNIFKCECNSVTVLCAVKWRFGV